MQHNFVDQVDSDGSDYSRLLYRPNHQKRLGTKYSMKKIVEYWIHVINRASQKVSQFDEMSNAFKKWRTYINETRAIN